VLSFADVSDSVEWYEEAGRPPRSEQGGLRTSGISTLGAGLMARGDGTSEYAIWWGLDSADLAGAIHRLNRNLPSTAKLPNVLKLAVFYDIGTLPFRRNNFASTYAQSLWSDDRTDSTRHDI